MDESAYIVSFEHAGLGPVIVQCKDREEAQKLMESVEDNITSGKYFLCLQNNYTSSWFIIPLDPIPVVRMYQTAT